jgi:hypothetical protein
VHHGIGYLLRDRVGEAERFFESVRRVGARGSVLDREVVAPMLGRRGHRVPSRISP